MAWNITFNQDTDKPGVGSATATYTDPENGVSVQFVSDRLDTNSGESIDRFITDALAKQQKTVEEQSDRVAIIAKITAVLNEKTK